MNDVKPCPNCGNEDIGLNIITEVDGRKWFSISCQKCGLGTFSSPTLNEAVDDWQKITPADKCRSVHDILARMFSDDC